MEAIISARSANGSQQVRKAGIGGAVFEISPAGSEMSAEFEKYWKYHKPNYAAGAPEAAVYKRD